MGKTLAESAAEILNASVGKAQEPAKKLAADVVDLGGATHDNPAGDEVGKAAANVVAPAPKPVTKGVAATAKTDAMCESENDDEDEDEDEEISLDDLSEEELDALLEELSEEELAALAEELDALEEEQIDEAKPMKKAKKMWEAPDIKQLVKDNMVSMAEDVDALFNGESLSEEFRTKATTIFEAAVQSRVEAVVEKIVASNEQIINENVDSVRAELAEQVDQYMNYVVEQWMEENQVAIESGIRAEIVENFMTGLKNLFAENYIDVPADKADLVEELASQVAELQETTEEIASINATLTEELKTAKKKESVRKICEGLTEVQIQKMITLAEGVEFTTEAETSADEPSEVASGIMAHYVNAISKSLPK